MGKKIEIKVDTWQQLILREIDRHWVELVVDACNKAIENLIREYNKSK